MQEQTSVISAHLVRDRRQVQENPWKSSKETKSLQAGQPCIGRGKQQQGRVQGSRESNRGHGNAFPETLDGKLYHPHTFTDSHISEVLEENYRWRCELEGLILERSKLKMESEADADDC